MPVAIRFDLAQHRYDDFLSCAPTALHLTLLAFVDAFVAVVFIRKTKWHEDAAVLLIPAELDTTYLPAIDEHVEAFGVIRSYSFNVNRRLPPGLTDLTLHRPQRFERCCHLKWRLKFDKFTFDHSHVHAHLIPKRFALIDVIAYS